LVCNYGMQYCENSPNKKN